MLSVSLARPPLGDWPLPALTGSYVPVRAQGVDYRLFQETAGSGRDVLCLHTAGADARQFHRLMAEQADLSDLLLRAFLARRIEGIMRFEKAKGQFLARTSHRPSLSRFIGRLRYPAV